MSRYLKEHAQADAMRVFRVADERFRTLFGRAPTLEDFDAIDSIIERCPELRDRKARTLALAELVGVR